MSTFCSRLLVACLHLAGVWDSDNDDDARLRDGPVLRHLSPSPPPLRPASAQDRGVSCRHVGRVSDRRIRATDCPRADRPGGRLRRVTLSLIFVTLNVLHYLK